MEIRINLEKKHFYFLSLLGIMIIGAFMLNAYNPGFSGGDAPVVGHSADEINIMFNGAERSLQEFINIIDTDGDGVIDNSTYSTISYNSYNSDIAQGIEGWDGITEPPECTGETNALQWDGEYWNCVNLDVGDSTGYLINAQHTFTDCENAGGEVVSVEGGKEICRFSDYSFPDTQNGEYNWFQASSNIVTCPENWAYYKDWSTSERVICSGTSSCTTGRHTWSNKEAYPEGIIGGPNVDPDTDETCLYEFYSNYYNHINVAYCYPNIVQVGCY